MGRRLQGPTIPTPEQLQEAFGITNPETLQMAAAYHGPQAPMAAPTPPPPMPTPLPGPAAPSMEAMPQPDLSSQVLPTEPEMSAFDGSFIPDEPNQSTELNLDDFDRDKTNQSVMPKYDSSGFDRLRGAIDMEQAAQLEAANANQQIMQDLQDEMAERAKDSQLREISQQKRLEAEQQKMEQALAAFSNHKIDSGRMFSQMDTGGKVMTGIALALGALGGAYNGGINRASAVIENAIKRDIDIQKAEADKLRGVYTGRRNLFKDMQTIFDNEDQAAAAAEAAAYRNAKLRLSEQAAKLKGDMAKVNAEKLYAELDQKELAAQQRFMILANLQSGASARGEYGNMRRALDVVISNEKDRNKASDELDQIQKAEMSKQQLTKDMLQFGSGVAVPGTVKAADIGTLNARIFRHVKSSMNERFTDKDVEELVAPFQITKADLTEGRIQAKLNGLKKLIDDSNQAPVLRSYGIYNKSADPKKDHGFQQAGK